MPYRKRVIKSSEIGQYVFCHAAWHLRRQGHEPASPRLERGSRAHAELGGKISGVQRSEEASRRASYIGILLLVAALMLGVWLL